MLDFTEKVRNPRISAASGMLLASRLAKASPMDDELLRDAVRDMDVARDDVNAVQQERERYQPEGIRAATTPMTVAFTSLHGALQAIALLPTGGARSKRAAAVLESVLPGGVAFLNGDASNAYHAAKRALDRALADGAKEAIDELIGPEFLDAAKKTTANLGEVLGVGREPRRAPSSSALQQKLGRLSRTIGRYLRLLAARVDEDDPESIAQYLQLMEPVDAHRESMRRRSAPDADEPESDGDTDPAIDPAPAPEPADPLPTPTT